MRCHATTHQHTTLHLTSDLLAFSSPHHITLSPSSVLSQKEMCKYESFCELSCVTHELSWKGEWENMYVCLLLSHYRIASLHKFSQSRAKALCTKKNILPRTEMLFPFFSYSSFLALSGWLMYKGNTQVKAAEFPLSSVISAMWVEYVVSGLQVSLP